MQSRRAVMEIGILSYQKRTFPEWEERSEG